MEDKNLNELSKEDIRKLAENSLNRKSKEDVQKMGKQTKSLWLFIISAWIIVGVFFVSFAIISFIPDFHKDGKSNLIYGIIFLLLGVTCIVGSIIYIKNKIKWDYYNWAIYHEELKIKRTRNQATSANQKLDRLSDLYSKIDGKYIKAVELLDSYTIFDNKLHAILNYEEIIQTRIYKFLVTFQDGSTKVYDAKENSSQYKCLISHIKRIDQNNKTKTTEDINYSVADEIRKYKELLDDNIITEEEFNKKKKELLEDKK